MENFPRWKATEQTLLTSAKFVKGPKASIETSPGYSETLLTKNSDAVFSDFFDLDGGKYVLPNPSEPWTKSAIRGFPLCYKFPVWSGYSK